MIALLLRRLAQGIVIVWLVATLTFLLLHIGFLNPLPTTYVPVLAYLFLFFSTWIITWLAANGPMKIFFVRWRFFGGRII